MSDVDKTISGLNDGEHFLRTQQQQHQQLQLHQQQIQATTNLISDLDYLTTKSSNFQNSPQQHCNQHHQQPQQHFQHKQLTRQQSSNCCYNSNAIQSAAETSAQQPTTSFASSSASAFASSSSPAAAAGAASSACRNNCISRILKLIFSTPGLVLLVVGYSVLGALIFPLLEAPQDITKSAAIAKSREDCLRELWIITEKLNVLYERNWTMLVHEQLRRFEGTIVAATRNGGAPGMLAASAHNTAIGRFGGNLDSWDQARWTFSEALLYSVTVITTIGHGSLTPKTAAGKIATIFYALIGVPLMLMCLSSLGALLAEALQCTYAKLCCRLAARNAHGSNGRFDGVKRQGNDKHKSQRDSNEAECHGKGQGLNCKGCKYDAIIGIENALQQRYNDYDESKSNSNCTLELGRIDESSSLLHGSPRGKMANQSSNSPCMQLKMMQQQQQQQKAYYQHASQQQQQQKSQQPPDVMLLAATQISATSSEALRQGTATATNAARSIAAQSPQHQSKQPQQATTTFHIVSNATSPHLISSTHSSPIHHGHQHFQQQLNPTTHQLTIRQHVPQHFVAIPSSMVRFQVAPLTASSSSSLSSSSTQLIPNCYQATASASAVAATAASVSAAAVAGTATIYFPIAGATATMPRTATTSIGSASASQLLCNQPIVKYHTIQLQHKKPLTTASSVAAPTSTTATTTSSSSSLSPSASLATANILNGVPQVQQPDQQQTSSTSAGGLSSTSYDAGALNIADALPLPPPPAYQTATVHGVRRAKFMAQPLTQPHPHPQPPAINTLSTVDGDVNTTSVLHDLSALVQEQKQQNMIEQQTTNPALSMATTIENAGDNFSPLSSGSTAMSTTIPTFTHYTTMAQGVENPSPALFQTFKAPQPPPPQTASLAANSNLSDSNATVDFMEDENDERLGDCPHGTPSRVPLLSSERDYDKAARGLINTKAAAFNRHTLQRANNNRLKRKSTLVTHHNGGNLQTSAVWLRRTGFGLDLDAVDNNTTTTTTTTIDDDEHLALTQFRTSGNLSSVSHANANASADNDNDDDDNCEGETDDELEYGGNAAGPQVPISIVLLILICYISLGTVIFALWENWSLIDGAYFCFVTLATIGYGDFMPERTFQGPEVQLFACCAYLLLGLVLVAMSFSILETQLMWKCKRIAVRLRLTSD